VGVARQGPHQSPHAPQASGKQQARDFAMPEKTTEAVANPPRPTTGKAKRISLRAVLLGLVLIPVQAWFCTWTQIIWQSHPGTVSLYFNAVVTLLVLVAANFVLRRVAPKVALSAGELGVIYVMQALCTALFDHDQLHNLVPLVAAPVWNATPDNKWGDLFGQFLKPWFTPTDQHVLWAYFDSRMPILQTPYWRGWVAPALMWSLFMFAMWVTMLSLNALFRRNWTDESKLSFPIVQLPLEMINPRRELYRSKLMWIGFGIAAIIDVVNGLHVMYPSVPSFLGSYYDLGAHMRSMPWQAIGWTPMNVFPFAVGLAFFIPLDLAFSCWFFYVWWKVVLIGSAAAGWGRIPRAPWVAEQCHGAYWALAMYSLYAGRKALGDAFRSLFGAKVDDRGEPIPYRLAMVGLIAGFGGATAFLMAVGATFQAAVAWLVIYLMLSVAIARIRAELGSPVHDLHGVAPEAILVDAFTARGLGKPTLVAYSFMHSFTRAHRSHPMPVGIEAMKIASETGVSQGGLAAVLLLTVAFAAPVGWYTMINGASRMGSGGIATGTMTTYSGYEAFSRLAGWLQQTAGTNWYSIGAVSVGLVTTVLLWVMRARFDWWPFHPAGYAVSGGFSMQLLAPSVFTSWLAKTMILRYGGMTAYRPASRFFAGLILGEFVAGTFWAVFGVMIRRPMYNFLP
jgi:hypothetical protein